MKRWGCRFASVGMLVVSAAVPAMASADAAKTVSIKQYVRSICRAVPDYLGGTQKIKDAYQANAATITDPTAARDAYATALGDLAAAEAGLIDTITGIGSPRVKGGRQLAAGFVKLFVDQRQALLSAQSAVAALPTGDVQALQAGLTQASEAVQASMTTAAYAKVKRRYPESDAKIGRVAGSTPACAGIPL